MSYMSVYHVDITFSIFRDTAGQKKYQSVIAPLILHNTDVSKM